MHQSWVRHDRQQRNTLLHPLFREISRSGRVFNREEVISALVSARCHRVFA
ncbi:DUF4440 domain-containing protein [Nissabacter archeti]|uniref:DUF4440 domain-containing protein n=1 Tax=Nissabacter archeti TaxID=1917880 RepID=UPI003B84AC14